MSRSWIDPTLAAAFAVATVTAVSIPRAEAKCQTGECGMNTAVLRQTRINALHLGGEVNSDGVALDVTSFRLDPWKEVLCRNLKAKFTRVGPPRPIRGQRPPLFLTIYEGELAAVDGSWDNPEPTERYRAMCLVGARFTVRVPSREGGGQTEDVHVKIRRFGQLESWVDAKTDFAKADERVPSYLIVDTSKDATGSYDDVELCPALPPMETWQLPNDHSPPGLGGVDQGQPTAQALLYQGEVYDDDANLVEDPRRTGPGWFYFTCPRTALHKARLMGMNPMQQGLNQTPLMRQATLKMITARYDGATPQTGTNIPLIWVPGDRVLGGQVQRLYAGTNYGALDGQGLDGPVDVTAVLEAVWGPSGALCLTEHLRVWDSKIDDSQVSFKPSMKAQFAMEAEAVHRKQLQSVAMCADAASSPEAVWTTYSPLHDHL